MSGIAQISRDQDRKFRAHGKRKMRRTEAVAWERRAGGSPRGGAGPRSAPHVLSFDFFQGRWHASGPNYRSEGPCTISGGCRPVRGFRKVVATALDLGRF